MSTDSEHVDCMGTHCTPMKTKVNLKVTCTIQFRCTVRRRKIINHYGACEDPLFHSIFQRQAGIVTKIF